MYEYHSAATTDATPTNSYAQLSWSGLNATLRAVGLDESIMFADVAWLAVSSGTGSFHGAAFEAGHVLTGDTDFVVGLSFSGSFGGGVPPHLFGGYQATDGAEGGHLRLVGATATGAALVLEYDSCDTSTAGGARVVAWLAVSSGTGDTRVHQQPTLSSDVAALLEMAISLRLPGYLRWRNGSDPCRDR